MSGSGPVLTARLGVWLAVLHIETADDEFLVDESRECLLQVVEQRVLTAAGDNADFHAAAFDSAHQFLHTVHLGGWRALGEERCLQLVHALCLFVADFAFPLLTGFQFDGFHTTHAFVQVGFAFCHFQSALLHCFVP